MTRTTKLTAEARDASARRVRKEREWADAASSEKIARLRTLRLSRDAAEKEAASKAAAGRAAEQGDPSVKPARNRI